jgi:hypothetical protein
MSRTFQLKQPAIVADLAGFVRVGLGHHDHAWHDGSSAVARTAQLSRLLLGLALAIDTRNTGWPRLCSSAQAR